MENKIVKYLILQYKNQRSLRKQKHDEKTLQNKNKSKRHQNQNVGKNKIRDLKKYLKHN